MEVGEDASILGNLRPPRLEDAGLEDCALPPDAIKEAFLKAADAVRSRAASLLTTDNDTGTVEDDGDSCVKNPSPSGGESIDALIGNSPVSDPYHRPCAGEKCPDGLPEVVGDEVAADVTEAEEKVDKVVGGIEVEEGGKSCVDGLQGLKIGEKNGDERNKSENDEEDEEDERPILVEGYL